MKYFAYGSNMSLARLKERVPSAQRIGTYFLEMHDLRFHKAGRDGSAKCDAFYTGGDHLIYGSLFEMDPVEKTMLDRAEGLGFGYLDKRVQLLNAKGETISALIYYATQIDDALKPYTWYLNHVLIGAKESRLPLSYTRNIELIEAIEDHDTERDNKQRAIYV